ncbi:UNVERIFIED_ORG: hypothetical protein DFS12_10417 [Chitinophaga ginsengisegetis]|nr:hypothetical protein [Chitinophaga ginsengisegetis]MDR6647957.1 hypothetical protein [Chitinophaga ginsengisegetis]MDR6654893.1 hypothetical protein [Chitinophaga ginsengisegetis]
MPLFSSIYLCTLILMIKSIQHIEGLCLCNILFKYKSKKKPSYQNKNNNLNGYYQGMLFWIGV